MNKEKVIPSIRFSGFTANWEQRRLKGISDFITKGATPTTYGFNWEDEGIPFFRNDSIKDSRFVFGKYSYISEEANAALIRSEIHSNDILIAITGDIGKVGIVPKSIVRANINQHMAKVRILKDAYPYFVYQYLSIDEMQKKYQKIKTGLSMPQLSLEQIRDTIVKLPSIEEQKKIGVFFKDLDTLITLHQRLLTNHKQLKKAMLQKMFPQKGESIPKVRFAGFNGDWREKGLSELAERFDNLRIPITSSERIAGSTPYYGANGIQGYIEGCTHDGEFILVAEDGANDLKNYPVQYVLGKVWVNNHAHVLSGIPGVTDNYFLMNSIKQTNIEPFLVGGGRAKLNANIMMKIKFYIPDINEQEKIGNFFKQLDETIALHENKLETYQDLKKAILQKMFI